MELLNLHSDRIAALLAAPVVQALVARAESRKAEVHALHPLSPEAQDRVLRKFRLDWTYHSNAIEGNALTYGETTALLLEGAVAQGKPMKDHEDIKGHHYAVDLLLQMVRQGEELRLHDVRNLHQLLLGKPFQVGALTPDGQSTQKWIYPGEYKDTPNHVRTATGEMHYYASPEETPALMTELFDWLAASRDTVPAPVRSALFHHAFVSIHPFGDGNGRMTRLLSNLLLMQTGYPPIIVRQQDRTAYYGALRQADAGEMTPLVEFLGEGLLRSLDIQLQGARGDFSFEQDDLDKEIALLKAGLEATNLDLQIQRSWESVEQTCRLDIIPLVTYLIDKAHKLDSLFLSSNARLNPMMSNPHWIEGVLSFTGTDERWNSLNSSAESLVGDVFQEWDSDSTGKKITPEWAIPLEFRYQWLEFKQATNSFSIERFLKIEFEKNYYQLSTSDRKAMIVRPYHQRLSHTDFDRVAEAFIGSALSEIKARTGRS